MGRNQSHNLNITRPFEIQKTAEDFEGAHQRLRMLSKTKLLPPLLGLGHSSGRQ